MVNVPQAHLTPLKDRAPRCAHRVASTLGPRLGAEAVKARPILFRTHPRQSAFGRDLFQNIQDPLKAPALLGALPKCARNNFVTVNGLMNSKLLLKTMQKSSTSIPTIACACT